MALQGDRSSLEDFTKHFIKGDLRWGSWFSHFRTSVPYLHRGNTLRLNYSEIVNTLPTVVDKVAQFCGFTLEASKRAEVIQRCGLEYMKQYNSKFDPRFIGLKAPLHTFIRKGITNDWKNELTPHLARLINEKLDRLKLDVDNADFDFSDIRPSQVSGTLRAFVGGATSNRFLKIGMAGVPNTVLLTLRKREVTLGDRVQLQLLLAPGIGVQVEAAEALNICDMNSLARVTFAFRSLANDQEQILANFCSSASAESYFIDATEAGFHRTPSNQEGRVQG
jgi:hypothetical protein